MRSSRYILYFATLFLFLGCSARNELLQSKHIQIKNVYVEKHISQNEILHQKLIQRFKEYWHYRQNGDYKKSYEYELPYQRYLIPFIKYKSLAAGSYVGDKTILKGIQLDKKSGAAILQRRVYFGNFYKDKKDKWIFVNGQWYHKFYQSILPPKTKEEAEFQ